jgi:hypothetical protein
MFSLREVIPVQEQDIRAARTFNLPLPHNSVRDLLVLLKRSIVTLNEAHHNARFVSRNI